jgi:hypothetical protein
MPASLARLFRAFAARAVAVVTAGALLAGCNGGGASAPAFSTGTASVLATLPAALATGCAYPSTQAQTTALPSAGGVSGTISLGALAQASSVCLALTVATGADATLAGSSVQRRTLATTLPTPLLQVELTNTYTGTITWTSTTLNVGNLPAGQYPATITSTTLEPGGGSVSTTVTNFTVTVDAQGVAVVSGPLGALALSTLTPGTNGVLSIYPAGTVLPTPSPSPSPTPASSPSPTPSASPSPSPTQTPSPAPTQTPSPAPTQTPSPAPTSSPAGPVTVSLQPATCQQLTSAGGTLAYTATASASPPPGVTFTGAPHMWYYGWKAGPIQPQWTVTQPPPTMTDPFNGTIYGTANTATVTVPSYATSNGKTGDGAYVVVELFLDGDVPPNGGVGHTTAASKIAVGTTACGTF